MGYFRLINALLIGYYPIMLSLDKKYLEQIRFGQSELSTLRALGECQGKQTLFAKQSPEVLDSLQKVAAVESTESSNRIEGIHVPHKRIEDLVLRSTKPKNRSEQEVAGYRDALSLIHNATKEIPFSVNVTLQLHQTISRYMSTPGGKWKGTDNEIIEKQADGQIRVRFKPVSAFETPKFMDGLIKNYKFAIDQGQADPLVIIPITILDFLCIHPFSDGNGRTARLITLLLLYHFDYQVGRYISLERLFEDTKEDYYRSLEESSRGWFKQEHDVMPWINYFWIVLIRAYQEFEERVGTVKSGRGSKTEQVKQAILRQVASFAISDIEKICPWVSRDMIRLVLRDLRDQGKIKSRGKGRGAKWIRVLD